MDYLKYQEQKTAGVIRIVKTDPLQTDPNLITYAVNYKQFDPSTGTRLSDKVTGVTIKECRDQITNLQNQINNIKAFLADAAL